MNKPKFIVFKTDDIEKYLTEQELVALALLGLKVKEGREADNKPIHSYLVVNMDEPYALVVSELISLGEADKEKEKEKRRRENVQKRSLRRR